MKKRVVLGLLLIVITITCIFSFNNRTSKLDRILESESYAYLPEEAKELVRNNYEKTGELIKTEKNKEKDEMYLNPDYVSYLTLSEEDKKEVDYIPEMYIYEFNPDNPIYLEYSASNTDSYYNMTNVNGKSYISTIKNQGSSGICWLISTIEHAESFLMIQEKKSFDEFNKEYSFQQLNYAMSTDGIRNYESEYRIRPLGEGGNFTAASYFLAKGLGFVTDFKPFNDKDKNKMELADVLNYSKSEYEVTTTQMMPTLNSTASQDVKNQYNNILKNMVIKYGGAMVSSQSPKGSCGALNTDDNYIIRLDDTCAKDSGHALQVIGWDDNYEYKYCADDSSRHTKYSSSCEKVVSGKGAWILRNSWGESTTYPMMAYDSSSSFMSFITKLTPASERVWDNVYDYNFLIDAKESGQFSSVTKTNFVFNNQKDNSEKIELIKFVNSGVSSSFNIYYTVDGKKHLIDTVEVTYPGIHTIDVSSKNLIVNNKEYTITVEATSGTLYANSISVFTSNTKEDKLIDTKDYAIKISVLGASLRINSFTRNIPSGSEIIYKLYDKNNNELVLNNDYIISFNTVANNKTNASIFFDSIDAGKYRLEANYGDYKSNSYILLYKDKYNISFNANGGTGTMSNYTINRNTSDNLPSNTYTKTGYIFKEWNTSSDGTGTTYSNEQLIDEMEEDLVLYAIWNPISYTIRYNSNGGVGTVAEQGIKYNQTGTIKNNLFVKSGYTFKEWNTKTDGTGITYTEGQSYINLINENNAYIDLYAIWEKNEKGYEEYTLEELNNIIIDKANKENKIYDYYYIVGSYVFTADTTLKIEDLMIGARSINNSTLNGMTVYLMDSNYDDDYNLIGYEYKKNFTGKSEIIDKFRIEYIDYEPIDENINIENYNYNQGNLYSLNELNNKIIDYSNTKNESTDYYYIVGSYVYTSNHKLTLEDLMLGAQTIKVSDNSGYTNKDQIYKEMRVYLCDSDYDDEYNLKGYIYKKNFTGTVKYNNELLNIKYINYNSI